MYKKIILTFSTFFQAFTISSLLLADSVAIIRYVMIFSLKNPAAINDHFWKVFINIWVYTFAFVTQIIYVMSPGHWNVNFYVCSGMQPFQVLCKRHNITTNNSLLLIPKTFINKKNFLDSYFL